MHWMPRKLMALSLRLTDMWLVSIGAQAWYLTLFFYLQSNNSGSTAICTFFRGQTIYAAWLGDSQAVLVRNGKAVKIIEPHKPNRPVSSNNNSSNCNGRHFVYMPCRFDGKNRSHVYPEPHFNLTNFISKLFCFSFFYQLRI